MTTADVYDGVDAYESARFADTVMQWNIFADYGRNKRVAEIGVHFGGSSRAFLRGGCSSLVSIEKYPVEGIEEELRALAEGLGTPWVFISGDSMLVDPPAVDVLFIDSLHTRDQLLGELRRYSPFVEEHILIHDTGYFGESGEGGGPGLNEAVSLFVSDGGWEVERFFEVYPGLTVLRKKHAR